MATFQPITRSMRNDGLYPVYIRITHNRKITYLKTDKLVSSDDVRQGKINDPFVNRYCYERIAKYGEWLNSINPSTMDVNQVRDFLVRRSTGRSFTDFYKMYVENHLLNYGNENNAMIYKAAYKSFEQYVGGSPVEFSSFNKATIMGWIESMHNKKRARTLYPTCLRKLFNISQDYGSDPSTGFLRMDSNPWIGIEIPRYTKAAKRAVPAEVCRRFFGAVIPEGCRWRKRGQIGRDVAMMVICLAGINTVDLYKMKKGDMRDGVLCYCRSKTAGRRDDGAYFEIRIPDMIKPLVERYLSHEDKHDNLFCFADLYPSAKIFNISVNDGLQKLCEHAGLEKLSVYSFRHSWATIAQNECGATIEAIGFAMNHSANSVTRGYVKIDFSPAWRLNEKVVDFLFRSKRSSKLSSRVSTPASPEPSAPGEGISPKTLIRAAAFCDGRCIVNFEDMGYSNADEVIAALESQVHDAAEPGRTIRYKIVDCDTGKVWTADRP